MVGYATLFLSRVAGSIGEIVLATRFLRPSYAKPLHESRPKNKGGRSAERRVVNLRTGSSDEHIRIR